MTSRSLATLQLLVAFALVGCLGDPVQLDEPGFRTTGIPFGWGGGTGAGEYVIGLDGSNQRSGVAAAFLSAATITPTTFATITQSVRADQYRGRRVRWSGWVRYGGIDSGFGGLWMRVDGPRTSPSFDNMSQRPLRLSSGWRQVSVVLDVGDDAIGISFGVLLSGTGDLMVDDLRMETVDATVTVTSTYTQPAPHDSVTLATVYARAGTAPRNLDFEIPSTSQSARVRAPAGQILRTTFPPFQPGPAEAK